MPIPPFPDFFAGFLWLIMVGVILLGALALFEYIKAQIQPSGVQSDRLMMELLEELRKLRSEIEELRRELKE